MNILILSGLSPPHYHGGYEINCEAKARGLEQRGHRITVLTSTYGVDEQVREGNVFRYLHPLPADGFSGGLAKRAAQLKNAILGRMNYRIAKNIAETVKPDLAYIWQLSNVSIFPALAVCDGGIPAVYELGDYWLLQHKIDFVLEKNPLKRLYRKALFGGDGFERLDFSNMIMISNALKRSYLEGKFSDGNITVIPSGIPDELVVEETVRAAKGGGEFKLLIASRIVEDKGVHVAVKAVRFLLDSLPGTHIVLNITGNGREDYLKELDRLIHSLQLQDCVHMRGQIPHRELMDEYAGHDVFLFPSIWEEPLGMTILEAMAKGVPVVASRVGGVSDMIEHESNGLLVAPDDPVELAGAVKRLLTDGVLYSSIRAAGIRTVREKFTREAVDGRTEDYLLNLPAAMAPRSADDRRMTR
jgi:glycosyltransferase involved in cell wall biosynthesis